MNRLRVVVAAVGAIAALASADAQVKRPMTIVALAEIPRLLDPQLSPDGRFLIYTLTRADWRANRPVGQIYRQAVAGAQPEQLTRGDAGVVPSARWSPDGKSILYIANRGDLAIKSSCWRPAAIEG